MQLQLEHLNRTFALQSSETHCCRWPLSLQSSRWRATSSRRDDVSVWACDSSSILHCGTTGLAFNFRFTAFSDSIRPIEHASATSCCLLDSQTWNRQGEGRREAGGRVCCTAEKHAVSSLRSNLNKPDVNSQKHRDTSTACRYDSNSSLVTLLRHVDAFRQVVCTNSRGGLNSSSTPQWSDTREANYATRSHDGPWIASWYYLHCSSTNFSRKVEWLYAGILLRTWKGSHGTSTCCS